MDIVIDLTRIAEFFDQPTYVILTRFLLIFGWIPIAVAFLWGAKELWLFYIRKKWVANFKFILLAIDIPRGNEQSPKAVENIFSYLAGAHKTVNLVENYWEGVHQLSFSFEVVSIGGYTQFLIRTPEVFRDLVESAVYSQYPDAEITEVNDYIEGMPTRFPDDEYDVWGAEFIQVKKSAYPIKTYEEFEHQLGKDEMPYKDTMAALMDLCSSLRKGEHLWYQIIVIPIGFDWMDIGDKEINKILGEKQKGSLANKMVDKIIEFMTFLSEQVYSIWADVEKKSKEDGEETLKMLNLKPKEKKQVEAINEKVGKLSFKFKIRFVYMAKKDVMNKPKTVNGFVGYIKQFASMDLNNIKPDMDMTATTTSYLFKEPRLIRKKNNIVRNYINRSDWRGKKPGIFNIEELATLWHFPLESAVKAPMMQKTPGRKSEPPMSLPVGEETVGDKLSGSGPGGRKDLIQEIQESDTEEENGRVAALPFLDDTASVGEKEKIGGETGTGEAEVDPSHGERAKIEEIESEPPANLPVKH